ncbi:hypothetical protein H477_5482 [[Clostridium] sordellii ATCC 9714]|nr:hypothetical protein H477_5482 [[Clostridium] sordellii ATCC 9714] [Paeniclostridium sordellii ATCC 9714]
MGNIYLRGDEMEALSEEIKEHKRYSNKFKIKIVFESILVGC